MEICNRCRKESERANALNPESGMLWNDDNQEWICQECDRKRWRGAIIGADAE